MKMKETPTMENKMENSKMRILCKEIPYLNRRSEVENEGSIAEIIQ